MEILWISGRRMGSDLAGVTEHNISIELEKRGVGITLLSLGNVTNQVYNHESLEYTNFPGLVTLSSARDAEKKIAEIDFQNYALVLIDWRFVQPLSKAINDLKIPWCIVDRGPPVYSGLLNRLQKWYWKRAWEIASESATGGFVVSSEHVNFVRKYAAIEMEFAILPAGSNKILPDIEPEDPGKNLVLSYIGRLDRRRRVRDIFRLSGELERLGINHEINICGEGNDERKIARESEINEKLFFHGKIPNNDIAKILAKSHVGIMTMPDEPIWRMSSPLKLAEYLASGLAIIGPKHPGNGSQMSGECFLLAERDWETVCAEEINRLGGQDWEEIRSCAVNLSEGLSWEIVSERMENHLIEWGLL